MVVPPDTNVIRGGVLIRFATNLGRGLGEVSIGRNLSRSSGLPIATIGVIRTLQMVFTNPIMTTHVNKIANRPPMNSIVVGGYKNTYVENPRGGYREPYIVTAKIPTHRNGHCFRSNKVALKYPNKKMIIQMFMSKCSIL
jgi:hypothetical protein